MFTSQSQQSAPTTAGSAARARSLGSSAGRRIASIAAVAAVLAALVGGTATDASAATSYEVTFSDGVRADVNLSCYLSTQRSLNLGLVSTAPNTAVRVTYYFNGVKQPTSPWNWIPQGATSLYGPAYALGGGQTNFELWVELGRFINGSWQMWGGWADRYLNSGYAPAIHTGTLCRI